LQLTFHCCELLLQLHNDANSISLIYPTVQLSAMGS
jgi:hypothetical protein